LKIPNISSPESVSGIQPIGSKPMPQGSESPNVAAKDEAVLGKVASAMNEAIRARDARVAELHEQHLRGSYHVDAAKISSKIVDEHLGPKNQ
jgi:anti-sigma28 factor (negative regulator of flagellin synthesis)